jgi:hypothetical protein
MADLTVTALDPLTADTIRYEIGRDNWAPASEDGHAWVPDLLHNAAETVQLADNQIIDVVILGDGYEGEHQFHTQLDAWIADFFGVDVYQRFRGAFRIHALFTQSSEPCSTSRNSHYGVKIDDDGDVARDDWWNSDSDKGKAFRKKVFDAVDQFSVNHSVYPDSLDVGGSDTVIHNQLASLYSNLIVMMLARTSDSSNTTGMTRTVRDRQRNDRWVNVGFGSHSLHEFGHAFAYVEDEYISDRGSHASRSNPGSKNIFTLSNLSFSKRLSKVPWFHVSPFGTLHRQAAGHQPSPIVGWLWRGGESDLDVWHSEYQCLMNGKHENYAFTSNVASDPTTNPVAGCARFVDGGADLRWRNPPRYCLWCQEIVVLRILEKTGQLAQAGDPSSINERGRTWYTRWVDDGRRRYWSFFNVDQQLRDREALYASPNLELGSLCQLKRADGTFLKLERSDLYQVFAADDTNPGSPPPADDGEELLMATS